MKSSLNLKRSVWVALFLMAGAFVLTKSPSVRAENDDEFNIKDPYIHALSNLTYDQKPPRPVPGVAYAFYNAGVQLFDVQDPTDPKIAGYYVPRFPTEEEIPERYRGNVAYGIYVEYDRNIVWVFSNNAIYALTSPALGEPVFGMPHEPWPPRG